MTNASSTSTSLQELKPAVATPLRPLFTIPYTYIHFSIIFSHRQFPHKSHCAFSVVVHSPAAPGAGVVHDLATHGLRLAISLPVEALRKRGILLECKCALFDARRVGAQDRSREDYRRYDGSTTYISEKSLKGLGRAQTQRYPRRERSAELRYKIWLERNEGLLGAHVAESRGLPFCSQESCLLEGCMNTTFRSCAGHTHRSL